MKRLHAHSRQSGQFMESYGFAAALVAVAVAAILVYFALFGGATSVQAEISGVTTAIERIRSEFTNNPSGFAAINDTVVLAQVPPDEVISGHWVLPVGGPVTIAPTSVYGASNAGFVLSVQDLPAGLRCEQIASAFARLPPNSTILSVKVGGVVVATSSGMPYSANTVEAACQSPSGYVSMAITVGP